jgi:hypothetical protein
MTHEELLAWCEARAKNWDSRPRDSYARGYGAACNVVAGHLRALLSAAPVPSVERVILCRFAGCTLPADYASANSKPEWCAYHVPPQTKKVEGDADEAIFAPGSDA